MKKKTIRRHTHHTSHRTKHRSSGDYLVIVRGWMFVVAFALMLGVGAITGAFLKTQLEQANPQVAGAQTEVYYGRPQ